MIFREIEIKSAGGCYKLNVTVIFRNHLMIERTPTGFVHEPTVGREIDLRSQPCVHVPDTGCCIKTTRKFRSEINIFSNTFQGEDEL